MTTLIHLTDARPYYGFDGQSNRELVNLSPDGNICQLSGQQPLQACNSTGKSLNDSRSAFGITMAGEFSNAINDCGLYVDGVGGSARYGSDCGYWQDASGWSDATKEGLLNFALASMDALGDWFFWTWKIGNSSTTNTVRAPLWSYSLGLAQGWMPADPRTASGKCQSLDANMAPFDGAFESWMTGGAGAGREALDALDGGLGLVEGAGVAGAEPAAGEGPSGALRVEPVAERQDRPRGERSEPGHVAPDGVGNR